MKDLLKKQREFQNCEFNNISSNTFEIELNSKSRGAHFVVRSVKTTAKRGLIYRFDFFQQKFENNDFRTVWGLKNEQASERSTP